MRLLKGATAARLWVEELLDAGRSSGLLSSCADIKGKICLGHVMWAKSNLVHYQSRTAQMHALVVPVIALRRMSWRSRCPQGMFSTKQDDIVQASFAVALCIKRLRREPWMSHLPSLLAIIATVLYDTSNKLREFMVNCAGDSDSRRHDS